MVLGDLFWTQTFPVSLRLQTQAISINTLPAGWKTNVETFWFIEYSRWNFLGIALFACIFLELLKSLGIYVMCLGVHVEFLAKAHNLRVSMLFLKIPQKHERYGCLCYSKSAVGCTHFLCWLAGVYHLTVTWQKIKQQKLWRNSSLNQNPAISTLRSGSWINREETQGVIHEPIDTKTAAEAL